MEEKKAEVIKQSIWNINCKYIIPQIFSFLNNYNLLKIIQWNVHLQKILNINISIIKTI